MAENLFDTDVLIDLSKGVQACMRFFDNLPDDVGACVSVITKMELLAGCHNRREQRAASGTEVPCRFHGFANRSDRIFGVSRHL